MSQKEKVVRPFEYCLEKLKLAQNDKLIPELRQEIIHGELSPDKAWREAKRLLQKLRATADLSKEDEALATSYWWLAKTKRDHREEFDKKIKSEGKEMKKEKFEISVSVDGVNKIGHGKWGQLEATLEFNTPEAVVSTVSEYLKQIEEDPDIVQRMIECVDKTPLVYGNFRNKLIQILEEKFGLKVKICENCRDYQGIGLALLVPGGNPRVICLVRSEKEDVPLAVLSQGCEHWAPKEKEVSEKVEAGFIGNSSGDG